MGETEIAAVSEAVRRAALGMGAEVEAFEKELAQFIGGNRQVICVNTGTAALQLAVQACGIGRGDEVLVPTLTFVSCFQAVSATGATPVACEVLRDNGCLDPEDAARRITAHTKAIMPVHLYGHPFDVDAIQAICRKHKLPLVEDAAQAVGAKYKGKTVGTLGDISCFSFYPAKNLGACGEGGALVTNNAAFATRAKSLREHGSTQRYHHDEVGYNYRMEGFQGAVLSVKLKHLAKWNNERRRVAQRYAELLADTPLQLPREADYAESAWHLYTVRHPRRDELKAHLDANGVGNAVHYPIPLHLQKAYTHLGHKPGDFPVAEKAARECLSLPMFPELTDAQIQRVAKVIKDFFTKAKSN